MNRLTVNQCAQCGADLIAAEWSAVVSEMYGPATLADISLRIRFTCLRERRRTHHKAPSNPAAWRYCWFSVIAGKSGKRSDIYSWDLIRSVPDPRSRGVYIGVRLPLRTVFIWWLIAPGGKR